MSDSEEEWADAVSCILLLFYYIFFMYNINIH